MRLVDALSGAAVGSPVAAHSEGVTGLLFVREGSTLRLVTSSGDTTVRCWDVGSGCMVWASRGWRQSLDAAGCKLGGVRGLGRQQQVLLCHCGWERPTCRSEAALESADDIVPWLPATSPSSATLMGQTALHLAIDLASASAVQSQLKAGCSVNSPGVDGVSPLARAAQGGHVSIVPLLLAAGAAVDSQAADGATALWTASQEGHASIVKLLLDAGADPNTHIRMDPSRHLVVASHPHLLQASMGHRRVTASCDLCGQDGSALACASCDWDMCGACVDAAAGAGHRSHVSALFVARMGGYNDVADALVASGAWDHDANASDPISLPQHGTDVAETQTTGIGGLVGPTQRHASVDGLPTGGPGEGGVVSVEGT